MKILVLMQGINEPKTTDPYEKVTLIQQARLSLIDFIDNDEAFINAVEKSDSAPDGTEFATANVHYFGKDGKELFPQETVTQDGTDSADTDSNPKEGN